MADEPSPSPQGDFDHAKCDHSSTVVLAGRKVCNSGCGKDLGPA